MRPIRYTSAQPRIIKSACARCKKRRQKLRNNWTPIKFDLRSVLPVNWSGDRITRALRFVTNVPANTSNADSVKNSSLNPLYFFETHAIDSKPVVPHVLIIYFDRIARVVRIARRYENFHGNMEITALNKYYLANPANSYLAFGSWSSETILIIGPLRIQSVTLRELLHSAAIYRHYYLWFTGDWYPQTFSVVVAVKKLLVSRLFNETYTRVKLIGMYRKETAHKLTGRFY